MKKLIYHSQRRRQKVDLNELEEPRIFTVKTDGTPLPLKDWETFLVDEAMLDYPEAICWSQSKKVHLVIPQHLSELPDGRLIDLMKNIKSIHNEGCSAIIECPLPNTTVRISECLVATADTVVIHTTKKTVVIKDCGVSIHSLINLV